MIFITYSCGNNDVLLLYPNGSVRISTPINDDSLAHGIVKYYYENGNIKQKSEYVNGKETGAKEVYYMSGNLQSKGNVIDREINGEFRYYYDTLPKIIEST